MAHFFGKWRPVLASAIAGILLAAGAPDRARAGGGPENVAVVVNAESWASLAVANEYVALRRIPECNVVYLSAVPSNLTVDVNQFRDLILRPVLDTLERRGLRDQIDCVAYSADLPYSVRVQADVGPRNLHKVLTPEASINGLTYLYELVLARDPRYLALDVNGYFRRRLGAAEEQRLASGQREQFGRASRLLHEKKWAEAEEPLRNLAAACPKSSMLQYDFACCLARLGKKDEAMAALTQAVEAGWLDVRQAQRDEDLASVRGRPEFKKLLEKIESTRFETQPPRAFHNSVGWSAAGEARPADRGMRYLLSTMLAVTSGRGNSVGEAIDGLRRSAAADGTCPAGTVYYMRNGDIRSTTRQWGFVSAAEKLKAMGVRAEVVDGVLPKDRRDVAGAMIGAAGFQWKSCGSTVLPGAICEHLTSFGGAMHEASGQTPLSEFLRYGAAAASGTVTEPYAIQAKFPTPFLHVYYASGCSLAEAFYQSVHGPYQLLIVGDPLCRPWAKIPKVEIEGLSPDAVVKGPLRIRPKVGGTSKIGRCEVFLDGRCTITAPPGEWIAVPIASLADGYHEIRLTVVVGDAVETQATASVPIVVDRHGLSMEASATAKGVTLDESITVRVRMPRAKRIALLHNRREVASVAGPEGSLRVAATALGLGPVRLQAVALLGDAEERSPPQKGTGTVAGERTPRDAVTRATEPVPFWEERPGDRVLKPGDIYAGRPLELTVTPPKPLAAIKPPPQALVPGMALSAAGQSVVIEQTRGGPWLAKAVKPGQEFLLEGYFEVPAEDVYQFQVRSPIPIELTVDGTVLRPGGPSRSPQYFPVSLAAGLHRLTVKGRAGGKSSLDLFFGGPGASSLGVDRFRCVKPVGANQQ